MPTAGYSGTPLAKKLGVKPATTLLIIDAPDDFDELLGELPADTSVSRSVSGSADLAICFVTRRDDLLPQLDKFATAIHPGGALWIAWPKKASGVETDLTRDVVRQEVLKTDLVDVKVCAISGVWSGLKFCWRKEAR